MRKVDHHEKMGVVEHLEELRARLMRALLVLVAAGIACFWQADFIFELLNRPLDEGVKPVTLSPTESLSITMTVCGYTAFGIALPVILYQLAAFMLPALTGRERRAVQPLLFASPLLFYVGAAFAYLVILEPALSFLLGFQADQFDTMIRARDLYQFESLSLLVMGTLFQLPILLLGVVRAGLVTVEQLAASRRYVIVGAVAVAALLPTVDPVSLVLETVPLVLLFEASLLIARLTKPKPVADPDELDVPPSEAGVSEA